jgi:RNA polymerase sigma-70 factor (ECF subfamily)
MGVVEREVVVTAREDTGSRPEVERADAFARLADRHLAASYRLAALLLGSEVEAQDAIQDAAVIGWERFADLRDPERFAGWFQRIVVNRCRDRLRQRRRIRVLSMDDALGVETPDGMSRLAERDALRSVIDRLSPDQRTVLVLRYFADLTLEEIADRTGEPLGTVKSRLHYARQALHAAYDAAERLPGGTR